MAKAYLCDGCKHFFGGTDEPMHGVRYGRADTQRLGGEVGPVLLGACSSLCVAIVALQRLDRVEMLVIREVFGRIED